MRPPLLRALAVALAALLAHLPAHAGAFVYDDLRFIVENPALEQASVAQLLMDPATASAGTGLGEGGGGIVADIWRPLRTLLFAGQRALFGLDPLGWHVLGLCLHVLNSVLLLRVLAGLCGGMGLGALLGALAFAVHPVGVEGVAWVSAQGDLLAVTLMLLALWVLEAPGAARTAGGALLCALACLAKESAVVLPGLLWLRDRALAPAAAPPAALTWRRTGLLAAVVAGYLLLRAQVLPGELAQVAGTGIDLAVRLRAFLAALAWHAGALLWPSGFRFEADLPVPLAWGEPGVVLGAGLLLTLLLLSWRAWRGPRPALALWWAAGSLVALVPVAQVLVPLKTLAAERFLYPVLPCAVAGLSVLSMALGRTRARGLAPALLLLAVPWGLLARERARAWHDEASLWDAVRRDRPSNARAYEGLGFGLFQQGRYQDGERAYLSYLQFQPYDGKARRRLADHLGNLVRTLVSNDPEVVRNSTLAQSRSTVQALQVAMLKSALACWTEVGYQAGRGSRALEVDTLVRLRDATMDLGDLAEAKAANDGLLRAEGVDPASREAVEAGGGVDARTCRWFLAWIAASTPPGGWGGEERARRQQQRAAVLRDVGIDPAQADEGVRRALEAPLQALRDELEGLARQAASVQERLRASRRALDLLRVHAELLDSTGRAAGAEALRREAQARLLLGELR